MKIQILMSVYSGSRYIRTQLDSIAEQTITNKTLLIRDDGSTDDTIEIIKEYQRRYSWISLYRGDNIGVQRSFLDLISHADEEADYVALADQDDLWFPDKLEQAVKCMEQMDGKLPLLYCSDKEIVGKNLEPINVTVSRVVRKISFGNALVQNICTGCTAVMNQNLVQLVKGCLPVNPESIIMHDWWLYLTASCFGEVYYDTNTYIKYRQHGGNTSGAMLNRRSLLKYRLEQLMKPRGEIYRQAACFRESYKKKLEGTAKKKERDMLDQLLLAEKKIGKRIRLALDSRYFRQKRGDDIVFRAIVLVGKL